MSRRLISQATWLFVQQLIDCLPSGVLCQLPDQFNLSMKFCWEFRPGNKTQWWLHLVCHFSDLTIVDLLSTHKRRHIDGLVHDCCMPSALAMKILQSFTKPSIYSGLRYNAVLLYNTILHTALKWLKQNINQSLSNDSDNDKLAKEPHIPP